MKRMWKLMVLATAAGIVMQINCGRFWGDVLGDAIWLRAID